MLTKLLENRLHGKTAVFGEQACSSELIPEYVVVAPTTNDMVASHSSWLALRLDNVDLVVGETFGA